MKVVQIPPRVGVGFGDGISSLFQVLERVQSVPKDEAIRFDMSSCKFLNPFLLLPLTLLIQQQRQSGREIEVHAKGQGEAFSTYLQLISFEGGLQPENIPGGNYTGYLGRYNTKTYIPIISFPASRNNVDTPIRESFLTTITNLLQLQLGLKGQLLGAVMYLIDEAVNNIVDHSQHKRGYIFAQYYPSRTYIDICIADSGIGILQTYIDNGQVNISSHLEAVKGAALGDSTKNRPETEGRGFGISTSKEMLVRGLGGKYFLYSGNAFLLKDADKEEVVSIPSSLSWKGTIVALRVPYSGIEGFEMSNFYE